MPILGYNANNVVVGQATAYIQPYVAGSPATLPANTVAYGTAWSNPWVLGGGTDGGWALKINTKTSDITIEEQSTPVKVKADNKVLTVAGSLAEDTLQSMVWSYGGGTLSTVAQASGVPGSTTLTLQDELAEWAIGLEMINAFGLVRRILIPRMVSTSDSETKYRRAAEKRMYPITFSSICAPSEVKIVEVTAPALP